MMFGDSDYISLIDSFAIQNKDLFLMLQRMPELRELQALAEGLRRRVLVLLPGTLYPCGQTGAVLEAAGARLPEGNLILGDVRLMNDPAFPDLIAYGNIREILLPFYECADVTEYGYKFAYAQLAETRASLPFYVHVTGVSTGEYARDEITAALGAKLFVSTGLPADYRLRGAKTESEEQSLDVTVRQCEKSPYKRRIVLCPTRTRAEKLQAGFTRRGTKCGLMHGGRTREENALALKKYISGEIPLLAATKSLIPSYLFLRADTLYCCGLPCSLSHAARCASLSANGELICIWSDGDTDLLRAQSTDFMEALQIADPAFLRTREAQVQEVLKTLRDM